MSKHTVSRALHDVGLAGWFGGTLANAVALNRAAGAAGSPSSTGKVANAGWDAWTPVNAAAIGAHVIGSARLLVADKDRMAAQQGVASMSVVKTALLVAALAATGYSRLLGMKVSKADAPPSESGTEPAAGTSEDVAAAQRKLKLLQWLIPGLTGALLVVSSLAGEQQRPEVVKAGVLKRLTASS